MKNPTNAPSKTEPDAPLKEQLVRQDYGIALPANSPLREKFNRRILRIIQGPEWARMLKGYFGPEG